MKKITSAFLALSMILAVAAAQAQPATGHNKAATETTTGKKDHADTTRAPHPHHYHKKGTAKTSGKTRAAHHHHMMKKAKADTSKK
jgi:Ni/Co efflux regulator RcnB